MIDLATSFIGVQAMAQIATFIHSLYAGDSSQPKASLAMLRVLKYRQFLAIDLAISNVGDKAFSIIDIFFEQEGNRYHFQPVVDIEVVSEYTNGGGLYRLKSRMCRADYSNDDGQSSIYFEPFNHKVFLQPGQSERGFVIFPVRLENNLISKFGLVTSVDKEVLFTK